MSAKVQKADKRVEVERATSIPIDQVVAPTSRSQKPYRLVHRGDARRLLKVRDHDVDLVVTSPPYWRKRDYGFENQIGQEKTPDEYVASIMNAMAEWRRVLRPSGSVFLNIGDTYWQRSLQGIPSLVEVQAKRAGWRLRNRIIWVKTAGMPDPVRDRLAGRHEYILHFALNGYYYDLFGYAELYSRDNKGANPGDVWMSPARKRRSVSVPKRRSKKDCV